MIFQRKVDRAMRYQKERNEQADIKKPTEEDKDKLSKKDLLAMILSAGLVILPVAAPIGSCEWNQDHCYGTRRCTHCIIHWWNHDLYCPDCKSRRLYPSDACFQDRTRSRNHGNPAYFYPCRYQHSNCILYDRQPCIPLIITFCI